MCRPVTLTTVLGIATLAGVASAQGSREQGPLLLVPRSSIDRSYRDGSASDAYRSQIQIIRRDDRRYGQSDGYGSFGHRDHDHDHEHYHGPTRYSDSRLQQINQWYVEYLGRPLYRNSDEAYWINFFRPNQQGQVRSLTDALATILSSDEFYEQKLGGRFDDWVNVVTEATSRPIAREEYAHWREDHRHARDRVQLRTELVMHLLTDHAPEPVVVPDRRRSDGPVFGGPSLDRGVEVPWYAREVRHDHEHETAYRGPAAREAAAIDAWYRTYLGRPAGEDGINTWLNQHRQGMQLDQIQASILGSTEAYAQAGSSPVTWVRTSLSALGLRSDDRAVGYWLDRHRRNGGDPARTALEMIRSGDGNDRAIRRFDDDD